MLENLSAYVQFSQSSMPEWEFLRKVATRSGCLLLLDVKNIVVSARDQGFSPSNYLRGLPADRIWQAHLAGHTDYGTHVIDTHDHAIGDRVWELYEEAIALIGPVSAMIERDDHLPPLSELLAELTVARTVHAQALLPQLMRA